MKRNMFQWRQGILNATQRQAMPVMTYPGLELAHRTLREMVTDGRAQFECVRAIAAKYPMAAALTTMDLSVEAEAFGSAVRFSDDEVPAVHGRIVCDAASVEALRIPTMGTARLGEYLKAAALSAEAIGDRPVLGGMIGPFSLAGRLFDMTEIMMALLLEPATIHALLEKCTLFLIEYAQAFKAAGANGVLMAEPAAGLLSPSQAAEFSSQYIGRIVESVQDESFMLMLHNCGKTTRLVPSMVATGAMSFHFGNAVDMLEILPQGPADRLVCGNLDPAGLFRWAAAHEVKAATDALLHRTENYPNFILSLGCDIPPGTPLENIEAFFEALNFCNRFGELAEARRG